MALIAALWVIFFVLSSVPSALGIASAALSPPQKKKNNNNNNPGMIINFNDSYIVNEEQAESATDGYATDA